MNKIDAQALVNQRVSAWTASSGVYVGSLVEVITQKGSPWRGRVLITGVLEVACHWEIGCSGPIRKGFRPGDEIEVGGVNIKPTTADGTTYEAALESSIAKLRGWIERDPEGPNSALYQRTMESEQEVLRREMERLDSMTRCAANPVL